MKTYWEHSHSAKSKRNLKRIVNKFIQAQNNNILKDDLWRGRFYVQMNEIQHRTYDDGSGNICYFRLTFTDLATGQQTTHWYDSADVLYGHGWNIWCNLNDFIVKDCDVWASNPREDKTVYRRK